MSADLTALETQVLQALAGLLLLGLLYLFTKVQSWLKIKLSDAQKQSLEDVATKSLMFGITQAQTLIQQKGWDHIDTKSAIQQTAANYAIATFSDTLKRAGVDTSSVQATAQALAPLMQRMLPQVAAVAVTSPTTPAADAGPANKA